MEHNEENENIILMARIRQMIDILEKEIFANENVVHRKGLILVYLKSYLEKKEIK